MFRFRFRMSSGEDVYIRMYYEMYIIIVSMTFQPVNILCNLPWVVFLLHSFVAVKYIFIIEECMYF